MTLKRTTFAFQIVLTLNPDGSIADASKNMCTIVTEVDDDTGTETIVGVPSHAISPLTEDTAPILGDALAGAVRQVAALQAELRAKNDGLETMAEEVGKIEAHRIQLLADAEREQTRIDYLTQRLHDETNKAFGPADDSEG